MALETQVGQLVTATTALQATVSSELTKVRDENNTFKTGLQTSFSTGVLSAGRVIVSSGSYAPVSLVNMSKAGNDTVRQYAFYNMRQGENGGGNWNAFALYQYKYDSIGSNNLTAVAIPFTIFDNGSVSMGSHQLGPMSLNSYAIGSQALSSSLQFTNTVGLGAGANVTGNNQIQLGDASVTVYSNNPVQSRSDKRDKVDIRPTALGLEFIKALNPVDYRWDMRDSYRTPMPSPILPEASESEKLAYDTAIVAWQESNKFENLKSDGTKKKSRFHHGLIAQEVEALIKSTGKDFGGFQDHKRSGGQDVLSIGYDELIAPLIKAVQELAQMNEELRARISTLESAKA